MFKNISFLAIAAAMTFSASITGCIVLTDDGNDSVGDGDGDTTGDGDGDAAEVGDGDGDATGDGDGDGDATGDGDGDATGDGDGDGDATGDGDGDQPAPACGWDPDAEQPAYYCGGEGEDPSGTFAYGCAEGLVEGEPCGDLLTGAGCCDADGNNWYCTQGEVMHMEECPA